MTKNSTWNNNGEWIIAVVISLHRNWNWKASFSEKTPIKENSMWMQKCRVTELHPTDNGSFSILKNAIS